MLVKVVIGVLDDFFHIGILAMPNNRMPYKKLQWRTGFFPENRQKLHDLRLDCVETVGNLSYL